MIPKSHRRLWRRRLRRRPLLPWLLAGTLVGDLLCSLFAVVMKGVGFDAIEHFCSAIFGGYLAQVALLAVWLVSGRAGLLSRLLIVLLGNCLLGALFALVLSEDNIYGITLCLGVFVYSCVVSALGLLSQRLQVGMQELPEGMSLVVSPRPKLLVPTLWRRNRWSISTLLLATTIAALIATLLAYSGVQGLVEFLTRWDELVIIAITTSVTATVVHEAARRSAQPKTVVGVAVAIWLVGTPALWRSEFEPTFAFAAFYLAGVVSVAFVWCAGLRGRRPSRPKGYASSVA